MQDRQINQAGPVDIPDAEAPSRPAASVTAARPRSAGAGKPAAKRPATGAKPASRPGSKRPAPGKTAEKKPAKKPVPAGDDDLPPWLAKAVDWIADLPGRIRKIPGKLAKLPGGFAKLWRGSWFYKIYFPVVALALVAMFIGWRWLDGFAADYEASQPVHVADQVAQLFIDGDYNRLYALDASAPDISGGDQAFYVESMNNLTSGRAVDCVSAFSSDKDVLKYNITLDGARFASFTLVPSGQTTAHGNTLWRLGTVESHVMTQTEAAKQDPNQSPCRVRALPEYTVAVDGVQLTAEDVTQTGIAILPDGFLPSGVTAPTLTEYGFFPETEAPQIVVTAPDGTQLTAVEESERIWVCGPREDEALKAQYSENIMKMARLIAKYTTQDVSRGAALEYVLSGSPAEEKIKKFNNSWAPSHKEERFEDMEVSDFWVLSEDCLVCHVKFTYILTSKRQNDYPYPTDYTFCIRRRNGEGKLYDVVFH